VKDHPSLLFKHFKHEDKAKEAYYNQVKLSKYNLAPRVYGELCKIPYFYEPDLLRYYDPKITRTNLGYLTEKAELLTKDIDDIWIEKLRHKIKYHTDLDFWDCHFQNIGYIYRGVLENEVAMLCCIDTGNESFYKDWEVYHAIY
jgi:hypothetical protein